MWIPDQHLSRIYIYKKFWNLSYVIWLFLVSFRDFENDYIGIPIMEILKDGRHIYRIT